MHKNRAQIVGLFGESLYRRWEFGFVGSELGFRMGDLMVFQIQLSKQLDAVPLTRDYMVEWERANKEENTQVGASMGRAL
jgi:cyclopropane-fatty-acyl-phospholipid synthase